MNDPINNHSGSPALDGDLVSIVIPCLNEAKAIATVITSWRKCLPLAPIFIVDNGSDDGTAEVAERAGAIVIAEPRRGKALAMKKAFEVLSSPIIIMVDGDDSYLPEGALTLIEVFQKTEASMVVGTRTPVAAADECFRMFHQQGTRAFSCFLKIFFGISRTDPFSGLRLFSKKFYKLVPLLGTGFDLEIELEIQAHEKGFLTAQCAVPFGPRFSGTQSKLMKRRDGMLIIFTMLRLLFDHRPCRAFSVLALTTAATSLVAGALPIKEYLETGLVPRLPLAVMAASLMVMAMIFFVAGFILESLLRHHKERFQIYMRASD